MFINLSKYLSEIIDLARKQTHRKCFSTPSSNSTPKQHRKRLKCFVSEKKNDFEVSTSQCLKPKMSFGNLNKQHETTSLKSAEKRRNIAEIHSRSFFGVNKKQFWDETLIIFTSMVSEEAFNNSAAQFSLPSAKRDIFDANYSYLDAVKAFS